MQKEKILISKEAYERIVVYGSRYANNEQISKEWRETYGVLIGHLDEKNNTIVNTAIPIVAGSGAGVKYESRHYADTAIIDEQVYNRSLKENSKEFFVGWWHTHPGFGFFFSETDTINHLGYQQANPYAIGIIYDHTQRRNVDPGIEVLRLEDPLKGAMSPYTFVDFELENNDEISDEIEKKLKDLLPILSEVHEEIFKVDKNLRKKQFSFLQRNYGLLSEESENEIEIIDSEKNTKDNIKNPFFIWTENIIERINNLIKPPKFRDRIEKLINKALKLSDVNRKKLLKEKIEKDLQKPVDLANKIRDEYNSTKKKAQIYQNYLDTDERKILEIFNEQLTKYLKKLNELIQKTKKL